MPAELDLAQRRAVLEVLAESRRLGFLGPGPLEVHVEQALAMMGSSPDPPGRALDLGAGGGVPGLVLASVWSETSWLLLDSRQRRTEFLETAVGRLGLAGRVEVCRARAEVAGRLPSWRGQMDLVVARGFGLPAITVECGAPFLRVGGRLVVAEPPEVRPGRWPAGGVEQAGLAFESRGGPPGAWVAFRQTEPCPDRLPRRVGLPRKRPLFPAGGSGAS